MPITSVSLDLKTKQKLELLAKNQKRSKSRIVSEAIDRYEFETRWERLQQIGQQIAKRLGIESDDDVERIAG